MKEKLMDGITVLSQETEVIGISIFTVIALIVVATLLLVACLVIWIKYYGDGRLDYPPIVTIPFILLAVFFITFSLINMGKTNKIKTYKVTVDKAVSFKEFDSKYEVIERNGDIYTITVRQDEKK